MANYLPRVWLSVVLIGAIAGCNDPFPGNGNGINGGANENGSGSGNGLGDGGSLSGGNGGDGGTAGGTNGGCPYNAAGYDCLGTNQNGTTSSGASDPSRMVGTWKVTTAYDLNGAAGFSGITQLVNDPSAYIINEVIAQNSLLRALASNALGQIATSLLKSLASGAGANYVASMQQIARNVQASLKTVRFQNTLIVGAPDASGNLPIQDNLVSLVYTSGGTDKMIASTAQGKSTGHVTGLAFTVDKHPYATGSAKLSAMAQSILDDASQGVTKTTFSDAIENKLGICDSVSQTFTGLASSLCCFPIDLPEALRPCDPMYLLLDPDPITCAKLPNCSSLVEAAALPLNAMICLSNITIGGLPIAGTIFETMCHAALHTVSTDIVTSFMTDIDNHVSMDALTSQATRTDGLGGLPTNLSGTWPVFVGAAATTSIAGTLTGTR